MAIKLLSLNIERDNHLPKVTALLEKENPEVICLQEVQEPDFELLKEKFGFSGFFEPMLAYPRLIGGKKKLVRQGNALFTTLNLKKTESYFYFGKGTAPLYTDNNNAIDRVLMVSTVEKKGKKYTVATTHFTRDDNGGLVNEEQRRDVQQLLKLLRRRELILCGDFNAPRGREIFNILNLHLKDNIPPEINTTLDSKLHKAGPLPYVVDYLWSTSHYKVKKVKIIDGVSDHMAIVADIDY